VSASLELNVVGERPATGSNRARLPGRDGYDLPAYGLVGAYVATTGLRLVGTGETRFAVRGTNLTGADHVEPGTGGIDIPGLGRTLMLLVTQEL
jgi:hypothetical protein